MNRRIDIFQNFRRKAPMEIAIHCIVSLIFSFVAFSYLYILIWCFLSGLKSHSEIVLNPFSLPAEWMWENFLNVFSLLRVGENTFWHMILNSVLFSVWGTFANQFVAMQFAYVVSKYKFPGCKLIFPLIMVVMTLPLYGTGGGLYKVYYELGLIDSYAQLLVFGSVTHMGTLYYMAYFENLSWSYAEAAFIDGANHIQVWFRVMMPQAKPLLGALFITNWLSSWNDYSSSMIYHPKLPNLAYGIYQFNTEMLYTARLDILFAACMLAALPALVLFVLFNKTITSNVSLGGLKG